MASVFPVPAAFGEEADTTAPTKFPLDLNKATLEEIEDLPISSEDAGVIYDFKTYIKFFESVYELRSLPGFNQEKFDRIRYLVKIFPPLETDSELVRMKSLYYKFQSWLSSEGTNEAIVDQWIDLARVPVNVNRCGWKELANLQNVSPIDAVAVAAYIREFGDISSQRSLQSISGLSNWGYKNLRTFVNYQDEKRESEIGGDLQMRIYDTPYFSDIEDLLRTASPDTAGTMSWWDRLDMDNAAPSVTTKFRVRVGSALKGGFINHRNLGEESFSGNVKGYWGIERQDIGPFKGTNIYFGNYLVSLGQGLVMENTDFFKPRKSGYGYDKRYVGILGDFSRTEEYKLSGTAVETNVGPLSGIFFFSHEKRDAVMADHVTPEGDTIKVVKNLITLTPRPEDEDFIEQGLLPMKDALDEITLGGNLRFHLKEGTYIGISGYESLYDHYFYPDSLVHEDPAIFQVEQTDEIKSTDNEFFASYSGAFGDSLRAKYRRVYGFEFQTVIKNMVLQAEYANLVHGGDAFVANGFLQFADFNFLALYRNYSVDFDNPYSRGFSNYQRYKGTILEDEYYLNDPIYGMLYDNSAQPQAEEGFFLKSRYKFLRELTATIEYDNWVRKADGSPHVRFVTKLSYRPIYPLILSMRHKYQARNDTNDLTVDSYINNEERLKVTTLLSKYDRFSVEYTSSTTKWPPRGRLSGNSEADGSYPLQGNAAEPGHSVNFTVEHNVTDNLELKASCLLYSGFVWLFEDTEFTVLEDDAVRWWVSAWDRISDRFSIYLKVTLDNAADRTGLDMREYNEEIGEYVDADNIKESHLGFRFQMDLAW